jgi:membrane-associated protein
MQTLIDLFLHLDRHLAELVTQYGVWVYGLLFLIIFAETGLVITPFLPGDSLLFAAGALAATGNLDVSVVIVLLIVAAVIGDAVNYACGRSLGRRVFIPSADPRGWKRFINQKHLDQAHAFFEKHGGKAIVLARFAPIVRTFVPFVSGAAAMTYSKFALYNVAGGIAWVVLCVGAGYAFGNIPIVKEHFSLVVLGIVAVSLLPVALEIVRARRRPAGVPGSSEVSTGGR